MSGPNRDISSRSTSHSSAGARRKVVTRTVDTSPSALDPYGIYGTRTANRRRALQQRRRAQKGALLLLAALSVVAAVVFRQAWRTPAARMLWQTPLRVQLAAAPVAVQDRATAGLLIPTTNGQLLWFDAAHISSPAPEPRHLLNTVAPLRTPPLVAGGLAFVAGEDGVLYALDWHRGRLQWKYDTGDSSTTRPARLEWTETVPAEAISTEAVPAATPSNGTEDATPLRDAPPTRRRRERVFAGNDTGLIVAVDATNGHELWRRRLPAPIGNALTATLGRDGQPRLLVPLLANATIGGGVWCLDARTGSPLWKFPAGGTVFAAQFGAPIMGSTADGGDGVYFANDTGAVFCLNLRTGAKIWKTFVPPLPRTKNEQFVLLRGEPLWKRYAWGRRLIIGGEDGGVRCFDADAGRLLWTFDAGAPVRYAPQPWSRTENGDSERNLLLVGCDDARVFVLDARDGSLAARLRTRGDGFATPLLLNHRWLAVSQEGTVQAFAPLRE